MLIKKPIIILLIEIVLINFSFANAQDCTYSTSSSTKNKGVQMLLKYDCGWTKTERNSQNEIQMFYKDYGDNFNTLNIQLLKIKENNTDFNKLIKNKNYLNQSLSSLNMEVGEFQKFKINNFDAYKTILLSDKINQSVKMLVIYIKKDDLLIEVNYGISSNNKINTESVFNKNFNYYLKNLQKVVIK